MTCYVAATTMQPTSLYTQLETQSSRIDMHTHAGSAFNNHATLTIDLFISS